MPETSSLSSSGFGTGSFGKESTGFLTAFFFAFINLRKGAVNSFLRPDSSLLGRYQRRLTTSWAVQLPMLESKIYDFRIIVGRILTLVVEKETDWTLVSPRTRML